MGDEGAVTSSIWKNYLKQDLTRPLKINHHNRSADHDIKYHRTGRLGFVSWKIRHWVRMLSLFA
jgi:hypothetical protein